MSTQKQKMRLADLERLSKENEEKRLACIRSIQALPLGHTAADVRRVTETCPTLLDEVILAGARTLAAEVRRRQMRESAFTATPLEAKETREQQRTNIADAAREIVHRVEVGSRVVELLDSIRINGKMLGDCTRGEIRSEAARDQHRSKALHSRAEWLHALANVLQPNDTARTADRSAVLAVLQAVPV